MSQAGKDQGGFTLIELLVVISIVGLLVGLLLPFLAVSKRYARNAQCTSNLHQIGVAAAAYEASNKRLPMHPFEYVAKTTATGLTTNFNFTATVNGGQDGSNSAAPFYWDGMKRWEEFMSVDFFACPFVPGWKPSTTLASAISAGNLTQRINSDYYFTGGYYTVDGQPDADFWTTSFSDWRFSPSGQAMSVMAGDKLYLDPTAGNWRSVVNHDDDGRFAAFTPGPFAGSAFQATAPTGTDLRVFISSNHLFTDGSVITATPNDSRLTAVPNKATQVPGSTYLMPKTRKPQ